MMENKTYILSTGRAGTTFLYKFFAENYPEFEITHQTRWSRVINILGNLPIGGSLRRLFIRIAFLLFKGEKYPKTTLDPLLAYPITELLRNKQAQNVKIIHLVRHPQAFANSFMTWKTSSFSKIILHYFIPFWQPVGYSNGLGLVQWLKMSKYEKFCWIWNLKNQQFLSLQKKYDYKRFKMEDLTQLNSLAHWMELIEFLNLPMKNIDFDRLTSRKVNKSESKQSLKSAQRSEKEMEYCRSLCNSLAKELGYYFA